MTLVPYIPYDYLPIIRSYLHENFKMNMRWLKHTREKLSSHLHASWKLFRRKRKRNCMPSFLLDFLLIIPNYPQQKFNLTRGDSSIRCGQGETIPVRAVILSYTHQQYWKKKGIMCTHQRETLQQFALLLRCSILLLFISVRLKSEAFMPTDKIFI